MRVGAAKRAWRFKVATELVDEFKDGVCWVELAALTDPGLVPAAVAKALGVGEVKEPTIERNTRGLSPFKENAIGLG